MSNQTTMTILCISSYFKGESFLEVCKQQGATVLLITSESLKSANWPRESIDEIFLMPVIDGRWVLDDLITSVSYIARRHSIDRIVALDDLDLEKAATLREHLRVPGLGETSTRYFRDKLAMRMRAAEEGLQVPRFVHVLNDDEVETFLSTVPSPWVLKPRSAAGSIGVTKIQSKEDFWRISDRLGDERSFHLIEAFVPGQVLHVDSIVFDGEIVFARAHQYMDTPMSVAQEGGIFRSHTMGNDHPDLNALLELNNDVITAMGLRRGVSHTEFIRADSDGSLLFLETSARVGGAHLAEMIEASSGINLWAEWAKIESLGPGETYTPPVAEDAKSGIIVSLARQVHPDTSAYDDSEIVWRLDKENHVGLIVKSENLTRVKTLLDAYALRFKDDFHASVPLGDIPPP